MSIAHRIYRNLPGPFQSSVGWLYEQLIGPRYRRWLLQRFVQKFFEQGEYETYVDQFPLGEIQEKRNEINQTLGTSGGSQMGDLETFNLRVVYALIRSRDPEVLVETGVCNGVSTFTILRALEDNDQGELYSVDYPFRIDESLDHFQERTFEGYGGAAIPEDKESGWIVPDSLRPRWSLRTGKSQRTLPTLLDELGTIDFFLHDSEHSHPCMTFEFELAWEYLHPQGIILSDDIAKNHAFSLFNQSRDTNHEYMTDTMGYILKP